MDLVTIFNRAKSEVGIFVDRDGPVKIMYLTLRGLTKEEYSFLFKLPEKDILDYKIFTDGRELCWMVDTIQLNEYSKDSLIQFIA